MSSFKVYFLIFICYLSCCFAKISDKRLCIDEECKTPISTGKTLTKYFSPTPQVLSFADNEDVVIYSKSAGSNLDYWGVEIRKKRGYAPKRLIKETKLLSPKSQVNVLVDTELANENIEPNKIIPEYEVIEGTKILKNEELIPETQTSDIIDQKKDILDDLKDNTENLDNVVTEPPLLTKINNVITEPPLLTKINPLFNNPIFEKNDEKTENQNNLDVSSESNQQVGSDENLANKLIVDETKDKNLVNSSDSVIIQENENSKLENENLEVNNTLENDIGDLLNFKNDSVTSSETDVDLSSELNRIKEPIKNFDSESNKENNEVLSDEKNEADKNIIVTQSENSSKLSTISDTVKNDVDNNENVIESLKKNIESENSTQLPIISDSPISTNDESKNVETSTEKLETEPIHTENNSDVESINLKSDQKIADDLMPTESSVESTTAFPEEQSADESVEPKDLINNDQSNETLELQLNSSNENNPSDSDLETKNNSEENVFNLGNLDLFSFKNEAETSESPEINDREDVDNLTLGNSKEEAKTLEENEESAIKIQKESLDNLEKSESLINISEENVNNLKTTEEKVLNIKDDSVEIQDNLSKENLETAGPENTILSTPEVFLAENEHCSLNPDNCSNDEKSFFSNLLELEINLGQDLLLFLSTTAVSVIVLFLGYMIIEKNRREAPLVAKINYLEKELLVVMKEKEAVIEQSLSREENIPDPIELQNLRGQYEDLLSEKEALQEQVQTLEKELENSTEVGLELNRMLSDLINSDNVGETLKNTVEDLQLQLAEQQNIVSSMKEKLSVKETENHEIRLELEIHNKKVIDLQTEIDKLLSNIIKIEEEKDEQQQILEKQLVESREKAAHYEHEFNSRQKEYGSNMQRLNEKLSELEHNLELKIREYNSLKETVEEMQKNGTNVEGVVEVTSLKAQLEQFKAECKSHENRLKAEAEYKSQLESRMKTNEDEMNELRSRYEATDKAKLELETKLQVLSSYFKEREAQLQKEVEKYEDMWSERKGEATSTSERMKYMQTEIQNYRAQNESLKEEIVAQEVELKSQISVLEKKVHENWVSARQAERKLEDLKHEAAQLRNRLTLKERGMHDEKNRVQSPLDPSQMDLPSSPPPLLFNRDLNSPPLPGLPPPPFLPAPPGAPFLSMPLPFMPPPPNMGFPGDHRPPPLGRMSSPPLDSRYSPDPRIPRPYSPYDDDRRSPSPSFDDESEYGTSPVHRRYPSYNDRMRNYMRHHSPPEGKVNGRLGKGALSSGSANSNDSIDKINYQKSNV